MTNHSKGEWIYDEHVSSPQFNKKIPLDKELVLLFTEGIGVEKWSSYITPLNSPIDHIKYDGLKVTRYHRECLCCLKTFIGYGPFNRLCYQCGKNGY